MQIANWKVFGTPERTALLRKLVGVCVVWAALCVQASAQVFTNLVNFNGTNGQLPWDFLVQGRDGNLWGPTAGGGAGGYGTVFTMTPDGTLSTVHNFDGADGGGPEGLVLGTDGDFYANTQGGGPDVLHTGFIGTTDGVVFKLNGNGTFTLLNSFGTYFDRARGGSPYGALIQGTDGNYYGTTPAGGNSSNCPGGGCGTVFKITPSGALTTLYDFDTAHGSSPYGGLV